MGQSASTPDFSRPDLYADPRGPARIGLGVIAVFLLSLTVWGMLAPISGAAIADGSLQVEAQRQSVQHPDGGVVKSLSVEEGQRVEKGQVLLTLVDNEPRAQLDVLIAERDALVAQEARLIAERDGLAEPQFSPALLARANEPNVKQNLANERAIMEARARQFDAETSMLSKKVGQLKEQIGGSQAQITGLETQKRLLEEELQGARRLLEKNYTPKVRVLALDRSMAQLEADLGARISDVAIAEQAIAQAKLNLAQAERKRLTEIVGNLRSVQARLAELRPKIDAARDVVERTKVVAPASGAVVGLTIFTEGGVVQPGAQLLDILPTDNPLIVEARLQLADVNQVKVGQSADVRLTGVPRSDRPQLTGTIMTVSADRLTDKQTGQGYYFVRIRLDPQDVADSNVAIQAGMPAQVIVTTEPRSFADYLLSPLLDEIGGAFRER